MNLWAPSGKMSKPAFSWPWKHQRWKKNPIPDSTLYKNSSASNPNIISANQTITHYCQTGQLEEARNMFNTMLQRTVVSWNAMVTGYSKWNRYPEAMNLISLMHHSNVRLNETTISSSLSVCARSWSLTNGKEIHGLVLKSGHEEFLLVGGALLYLYASCYEITEAKRVFDELCEKNELVWSLMLVGFVQCSFLSEALKVFEEMPRRGVVEWTTLISGYAKSEDGCQKALELFKMMRKSGEAVPNEFTLDSVVRACGRLMDLWEGKVVHGLLIKLGFEFECSITGALIGFYIGCEVVDDAKRVYDGKLNPCLSNTNLLVGGLIEIGRMEEAELIFSRMVERNPETYNLMIKAYAMCGRIEDSKKLFTEMPVRILATINTMISVYARNGEIDKALELFEETKGERNPVTWNSMISGYIQNDRHENALKLYLTMRRQSISQTRSTFSALFHACAFLGSLQQGQLLHAHLAKTPFETNVYVGTALTDMYSKCGSIEDARASFSCVSSPNVAAWTALINGHAHHGLGSDAVSLFNLMLERGIDPNAATFVSVLSACTRAGLVDEGMSFFRLMKEQYGIIPTLEHFTCVVDLLGRSGNLLEAEKLIEEMPIEPDKILLIAFLNACWFWMDMEVGERVAEKIFSLDPKPTSACVIMSNMYSGSGKWREKIKVRDELRDLEVKKVPGCSWIQLNHRVHVFSADDRTHPCCNTIYATMERLMTNVNYSVQLDFISS
ncbi:pentatricopeptide repeat-containing protein At2g13600-like [Olea europaea var. sylvestris]|uniref:pentatricopeptide repeat-containing protein At2g13600-like n=1 Tax=Olea europaea var. sylvestris TaxID=158386 RepID=UPI000C1D223B|nr:pentatricopeptide repeat-containing protein At2g13600-like [Olea europaea var. sylvestris]